MPSSNLQNNKTVSILRDAERGGYGVLAAIVYTVEHIVAKVRAAERKRSPLIIQMFPWAITASDGLLIRAAADAASRPSVPIAIHLDHAQDKELIRHAADTLPFDSIMVDMSHYEKAENLSKTAALVDYCHARGIATEAEPGRIEGGEDGVADTVDLESMLTTPEELEEFIQTGVDFLAPAFGNVHGEYGARGPQMDFERLQSIRGFANAQDVRVVLHGTNGFTKDLMRQCIAAGVSKINVNKLTLESFQKHLELNASKLSLTKLLEECMNEVQQATEEQMDICMSSRKA